MSKQTFSDWKRSPITQTVYHELEERVKQLIEELIEQAGNDPVRDAERSGAIKAYRDLLNIDYSELPQEEKQDD